MQFLAEELSVATPVEAKDRVYFVSAREALIVRLQASGVQPGTPGTPGGCDRYTPYSFGSTLSPGTVTVTVTIPKEQCLQTW